MDRRELLRLINEGDIFRKIIPLVLQKHIEVEMLVDVTDKTTYKRLSGIQKEIIALIRSDPWISQKEMAEKLGLNVGGIGYHTDRLKVMGVLKRVGEGQSLGGNSMRTAKDSPHNRRNQTNQHRHHAFQTRGMI